MKNFKRFIVPVALCAVLIGAGVAFFYKKGPKIQKPDQFVQEKEGLNRLIQNSSEIHRMWIEGEESREWSLMKADCLKLLGVTKSFDESLLRCNPVLLQCFSKFAKNQTFRLVNLEEVGGLPYRSLTKSNSSYGGLREVGVAVTLEDLKTKKTSGYFFRRAVPGNLPGRARLCLR